MERLLKSKLEEDKRKARNSQQNKNRLKMKEDELTMVSSELMTKEIELVKNK